MVIHTAAAKVNDIVRQLTRATNAIVHGLQLSVYGCKQPTTYNPQPTANMLSHAEKLS